ncbi:bifunctional biotin--[acetyl-CoA-carboxylase] ligase/biotin operon repressor BirA [Xanthomonas translucens]|uniref:bifunctional biotin--[acetyl-CoA-carboxylase] ligase/biotin operon repressor BirA n=1 Tax=Xanthomonas campestris pv. translucens TaxID=343 RepID=UPI001294CE68|nr:bifunctional biotin--[acetyl-CoA-carboxylase] ligase/biotin operon repressor BirA [Xanthomonas translucens]MCS3358373.1 bifunctional biotin--[acetyl-CoA-carboxylase] ligase/biotin operon repressor BirA [Xanthomonas translucens pv. translucens]MCS3371906.1 bifunctional biotin--[acetyl-CoA-carboxylase] ligase/biotin operon repressor BirA [Xanthomonas translucens pv. translucens]MCT8275091.1 bifunctional biotin--[acetyl-CoA-carboxylase] ligase/biotin operon repressor BirA [Xanthomonas translucen
MKRGNGIGVDERELLARLSQGRLSGDALARSFGLTRAAVWKRIQGLRAAGVEIDGRAGEGYGLARPLELLEAERIRAALAPAARAELAGLEIAWSLASSNSTLLARPAPPRGSQVLLAERQTGGRGRRGRVWASPLAAHLYLSVARGFDGGLGRLGGLSLAAGVAVAEALHAAGFATVGLKWPNDLLADGHKLGGLLVEGGGEFAGPARAVIGLGLNVRMPAASAASIDQPWTDLATLAGASAEVSRNAIAATVLSHLLPALALFDAQGLAPFLPRYAALDLLAGRAIRIDEGGVAREGVALGLADDGALRVAFADGERALHAGEVSVRPA